MKSSSSMGLLRRSAKATFPTTSTSSTTRTRIPAVFVSMFQQRGLASSIGAAAQQEEDITSTPHGWERYANLNVATGRLQRPIFVAATKQHVGKTTVSLALMSGLQKRFEKVGFLKPVGQQVSCDCISMVLVLPCRCPPFRCCQQVVRLINCSTILIIMVAR